MNNRQKQVGFSQRIRLEWLQQTANLVLAGNDKEAVNASLQELLQDKVSVGGHAMRGNKEKAITILMKIWLNVPRGLGALCSNGLELLKKLPRKDQIAVHWGMAMAVYPFWAAVAANTGRLLRLQGTAAAAHVQRRVREQYGERETVSRAARRVIRSFVDWGVLSETSGKGIYGQGLTCSINDPRLISWLIEASLHARFNGSAAIKDLLDSTSLFPFRLAHVSAEYLVSASPRLDILRHGLDDDSVILQDERDMDSPKKKEGNNG
ncbi:MAG: hypothetical protein LWX01_13360 [Deltaproteobacteria bacterium]|nr:hypothetical protein [Deltaproteobacteria bacterium]MDL1962651.1 hypothetical protein [Deltaproteobacteria bacterium]